MVGHQVLVLGIGVRVPVSQPFVTKFLRAFGTRNKGDEGTDADTERREVEAEVSSNLYVTMSHFTYILECSDGSFYVGCTNDLKRRLDQHNDSKSGAHYTKIRRPVKLLYSETFKTLTAARQRESEIKGWRREKKLSLIRSV